MRTLILVSALIALAIALPSSLAESTSSCTLKDGAANFAPWPASALSPKSCKAKKDGSKGTCVAQTICQQDNHAEIYEVTDPPKQCYLESDPSIKCCRPTKTCTAKPALETGGIQRQGQCLAPRFCSNAVSATVTKGECGTSALGDLACCVEQTPQSSGVPCSERFTVVETRMNIVQNKMSLTETFKNFTFAQQRLTNFLPYAMKKFDELRDPELCLPLGDCSAASYLAFVFHMLYDLTSPFPNKVIDDIQKSVPAPTWTKLSAVLSEKQFGGHITPEAFGRIVYLLWTDEDLNLLQYGSGTCADWIMIANAVRGPNSGWKCDKRWFALMASEYCRPTMKSSLRECAGGAGICYANGNSEGVCEEAGLVEDTGHRSDCTYGSLRAFCCKKTEKKDDTSMSFDNNEYNNLRIAIDPNVPESANLLLRIQEAFTKASSMLYEATDYRAVFRSIRIILPPSWSPSLANSPRRDEKLGGAEFIIKPNVGMQTDGVTPYRITMNTLQIGYCGARGLGTTMTPMDIEAQLAPAQIVKHFAMNRYGIFHEFPRFEWEIEPKNANSNPPERCVEDGSTSYVYCNEDFTVSVNSTRGSATGSLAWLPDYREDLVGVENIIHFCDDRDCDPHRNHNKKVESTHNRICKRKGTLNVILESEDFYQVGTPVRKGIDPKPTFVIVHEDYQGEEEDDDDDDVGETTVVPWTTAKEGTAETSFDVTMTGEPFYDDDDDETTMKAPLQTTVRTTKKPPTPEKRPKATIVLVLDESGSMEWDNKMTNLKSAAGQFVDLTDPDIEVAVVSFQSSAKVRSPLKTGTTEGRKALKDAIYQMVPDGGTCIEEGLFSAIDILAKSWTSHGSLILMTDGDDNCGKNYISKALARIEELKLGVSIHTCAITGKADPKLQELAEKTNGKSFVITNGEDTKQFLLEMQSLLIEATQDDSSNERVTLFNNDAEVHTDQDNSIDVNLDMGLGKRNLVTVLYNKAHVSSMIGNLFPPTDISQESSVVPCSDEPNYGKMNCEINFKPVAGKWTLRVRPKTNGSGIQKTSVTVTASATVDTTDMDTFQLKGMILKPKIYKKKEYQFWEKPSVLDNSQAFVATLSFGRFAVLNADITAVIRYENGKQWHVMLSDNGEANKELPGPDLYENDGVYSALFNNFTNDVGRYSVSLEVIAHREKAYYTRDVLLGIPKSAKYLSQVKNFRTHVSFSRVLSIGMFEVIGDETRAREPHVDDVKPKTRSLVGMREASEEETPIPGRVAKLSLVHSFVEGNDARLYFTWLAVGRDGMTANHPDVYALNASANVLNVEGRGEEIERTPLSELFESFQRAGVVGDEPGKPLLFDITLPLAKWQQAESIYISVAACNLDEMGSPVAGAYSNIIITSIEELLASEGVCRSDGSGDCQRTFPLTKPKHQKRKHLRRAWHN